MKVLFVGGGNMAQAILGGLATEGLPNENFCVVEPLAETRALLAARAIATAATVSDDLLAVDAIVLAVKPQMMQAAILPFAGKLDTQVVISIAAGINTQSLAQWLGTAAMPYENVVRTMPNTPAVIGAGISGLFAAQSVTAEGREMAASLLGAVGKTVWLNDEAMLDAVTAVSGSGPAYVFYFIEALEQAAREMGFDDAAARLFATETFLGGAKLAAASSEPASVLRARVTSKRGTTERAIEVFDNAKLKAGFIDGVKAAAARSRELASELGAPPNTSGTIP